MWRFPERYPSRFPTNNDLSAERCRNFSTPFSRDFFHPVISLQSTDSIYGIDGPTPPAQSHDCWTVNCKSQINHYRHWKAHYIPARTPYIFAANPVVHAGYTWQSYPHRSRGAPGLYSGRTVMKPGPKNIHRLSIFSSLYLCHKVNKCILSCLLYANRIHSSESDRHCRNKMKYWQVTLPIKGPHK